MVVVVVVLYILRNYCAEVGPGASDSGLRGVFALTLSLK